MTYNSSSCNELVSREPFIETKYLPPWKMKLVTDYVAEIKSKFAEGITTGAAYFEKVCINFKVLLHFFSVNHIPKEVVISLLNQDFKRIYGEKSTVDRNKTLLAENHIVHLMIEILEKKRMELDLSEHQHSVFHELLQEVLKEQNKGLNEASLSPSKVDSGTIAFSNIVLNTSRPAPRLVMPPGDSGHSLVLADSALEWFLSKRVLQLKASARNWEL